MTLYAGFPRWATPNARPHSLLRIALCLFGVLLLMPTTNSSADQTAFTYGIGDSRINASVDQGPLQVSNQDLRQWVSWAAESVNTYYHRYPVPDVRLRIIPTSGEGVRGGTTFPAPDGGFIRIHVGSETTMANLAQDWMLTHEMVHLTFPSVAENHHWIEEGIATYVEPIARVRAGHMDAHEMWFELVRDLHQGLPQSGDEGLDHTHTWGRTYWGGALFCFLADVEIHKQTNNAKGLDNALRGILQAGGDIRKNWELTDALRIGDQATGVSVLVPLYDKMKDKSYDVDLAAMWKDLGVERAGDTVRFLDSAPLAKTRDAITFGAKPAATPPATPKQ
jgi:hypothetical protein